MSTLDRVRELMRGHDRPVWMDERAAAALLYPARQVQAAPINPPLTTRTPELERLSGARGEQVFVVPEFTP